MLVGWRGWWQRMEAEARKDQARLEKEEDWIKSRSQNNRELKCSFIRKYFGIVGVTSLKKEEDSPVEDIGTEISGRHISLTPKRKMSFNHTHTNSVEKKSRKKISTHKLFQEESHAVTQPAILSIHVSENTKGRADNLSDQSERTSAAPSQGRSGNQTEGVII